MTVTLTGTVTEPIQDGAYVQMTVNLGLVRLLYRILDLGQETGASFPIPAGPVVLEATYDLGDGVPRVFHTRFSSILWFVVGYRAISFGAGAWRDDCLLIDG